MNKEARLVLDDAPNAQSSILEMGLIAACSFANFPEDHLATVLREPISRALSNYRFTRDQGLEKLSATEAFALDYAGVRREPNKTTSVNSFHYLRRSRYASFLPCWISTWPPDAVSILVFGEMIKSTDQVNALLRKIGITQDVPASAKFESRINNSTTAISIEEGSELRARYSASFTDSNAWLENQGLDLSGWVRVSDNHV